MASQQTVTGAVQLVLPSRISTELHGHLFPGDGDEHGAVIAAGMAQTSGGPRLLARDLFVARDGVEYVPGERGYRMLRAEFVRDVALYCRNERLCYLAVHNHGGRDAVAFSSTDLESHDRGYPALLDVIGGPPVGALVFAENAVAGDIWFSRTERYPIEKATVVGRVIRNIYPQRPDRRPEHDETYDRHTRLFGDAGQQILRQMRIGVVGAGGVGSLLIEWLARLGVGQLVIADPQRIDLSNLPRVAGATRRDARSCLTEMNRPRWIRRFGEAIAVPKVRIASRVANAANPHGSVEAIMGDFANDSVARRFLDCDFIFLAADSMQARLVFNALVHQYLIPGVQVGSKVSPDPNTGRIIDVFSTSRPVTPDVGCLWCNGLISGSRLQKEAATSRERASQQYVPDVIAPSVITLNATAAAAAANDFLFSATGLVRNEAHPNYLMFRPVDREVQFQIPRADQGCTECGRDPVSRFARGDSVVLPTRDP